MSVGNLQNSKNLIDGNTLYCDTLVATNIESDNFDISNVTISPDPPTNNSLTKILALNSSGLLSIRDSSTISPGIVTPVVANNVAKFNNTSGLLGDSGISSSDICQLSGTQTITGSKTFRNTVSIGNPTIVPFTAGAVSLFLTTGTTTTISAGTSSVIPLVVTTPNASTIRFPDLGGSNDVLVCRNTSDTLTNKTIDNLNCIGSVATLASGGIRINYVGLNTNGAVTIDLLTIPLPIGRSATVTCSISGLCTAGPDQGKVVIYDSTFGAKNVAGTVTAYTVTNNSQRDAAFGGAVLTAVAVSPNLVIRATGIASDVIFWAGGITSNI